MDFLFKVFIVGASLVFTGLVVWTAWPIWFDGKPPDVSDGVRQAVVAIGAVFGSALTTWLGIKVTNEPRTSGLTGASFWKRFRWFMGKAFGSLKASAQTSMGIYLIGGGVAAATFAFHEPLSPRVIAALAATFAAQALGIATTGLARAFSG